MRIETAHPQHFWLRGENPEELVAFDESTGVWGVHGHPETVEIISDFATYSSDTSRLFPMNEETKALTEGNLVQLDPPDHRKLRRLVSHAFTPRVVAGLEPRIEEVAGELLDAVAGQAGSSWWPTSPTRCP